MAIFRVHKTRDYTVMSNHHLKDKGLTLKAKGLLSLILSLPDDWNYTTRGLAAICREGVDSISGALKELEQAGYIVRQRLRDDKGRITDTEYMIYETPEKAPDAEEPDPTQPYPENPDMENPHPSEAYPVMPGTEMPAQSKTYQVTTNSSKTKKSTALRTNPSNPNPSKGGKTSEALCALTAVDVVKWRKIVRRNVGYDDLATSTNREQLDNMVEIIVETLCSGESHIAVAGGSYPAPLVKQRLLTLNSLHIQYALECLQKNTSRIRNIKRYLLTTLFNAPATMGSYYDAAVRHDQGKVGRWCDDGIAGGESHG